MVVDDGHVMVPLDFRRLCALDVDAKQSVKGVCYTLDLLDAQTINLAKVEDRSISWADLWARVSISDKSEGKIRTRAALATGRTPSSSFR